MTREHYPLETDYLGHIRIILREHREILQAIQRKDSNTAERLAQSHADLARRRVIETLVRTITPEMDMVLAEPVFA